MITATSGPADCIVRRVYGTERRWNGSAESGDNAPMHARLIGLVAALGLAALGSPTAEAQDKPPRPGDDGAAAGLTVPYTQFTLTNGLHVILHQDKTVPVAAVNLWYHVGSGREKPGRTGFAHLFEHIMFEGSQHVPEGSFDGWLEAAGGSNNGSTSEDRTNYIIDVPSNALELALFLESDRMGYLLPTLTQEQARRPARRGEEREAAARGQRAVRAGVRRTGGAALSRRAIRTAGR